MAGRPSFMAQRHSSAGYNGLNSPRHTCASVFPLRITTPTLRKNNAHPRPTLQGRQNKNRVPAVPTTAAVPLARTSCRTHLPIRYLPPCASNYGTAPAHHSDWIIRQLYDPLEQHGHRIRSEGCFLWAVAIMQIYTGIKSQHRPSGFSRSGSVNCCANSCDPWQ